MEDPTLNLQSRKAEEAGYYTIYHLIDYWYFQSSVWLLRNWGKDQMWYQCSRFLPVIFPHFLIKQRDHSFNHLFILYSNFNSLIYLIFLWFCSLEEIPSYSVAWELSGTTWNIKSAYWERVHFLLEKWFNPLQCN